MECVRGRRSIRRRPTYAHVAFFRRAWPRGPSSRTAAHAANVGEIVTSRTKYRRIRPRQQSPMPARFVFAAIRAGQSGRFAGGLSANQARERTDPRHTQRIWDRSLVDVASPALPDLSCTRLVARPLAAVANDLRRHRAGRDSHLPHDGVRAAGIQPILP